MNLKGKHFLNTADFSQEEVSYLIEFAMAIKAGKAKPDLSGKMLATLFFNPSVRTRVSFAGAMFKLGGLAIDLAPGQGSWTFEFRDNIVMDGATIEHIKEAAPVISRYCNGIAVRSSELVTTSTESVKVESWDELKKDKVVQGFAKYATVPVVNMESNVYHPCQGLGDALTIKEKLGKTQGRKYVLTWAYHPKALPMATPNSQILGPCDLGMDVVVTYPEGWELDPGIMQVAGKRARESGGSLTFTNNQVEAFKDADVICAKSWGALKYYGDWTGEKTIRQGLKSWIVNDDLMKLTNRGLFMHCLPVRRNIEVTDSVLDGPNSIVIDQAENRMWAQMAILASILADAAISSRQEHGR